MIAARSKSYLLVFSSIALSLAIFLLARSPEIPFQEKTAPPGIKKAESLSSKTILPSSAYSRSLLTSEPLFQSFRDGGAVPRTSGEDGEIFWREVEKTLSSVIREKFPEVRISQIDLRVMTENIRTIRESMQEMRELERTVENVETLKNLRSQVEWAHQRFQETIGMSVAEFIEKARDEKGIDDDSSDDGETVVEYIRDHRP